MSSLLSSPQVFQNGLVFSELKRALCLHRKVAFSSMRAVEKELEGKKCNILVGQQERLPSMKVPSAYSLQRLIVGVCSVLVLLFIFIRVNLESEFSFLVLV